MKFQYDSPPSNSIFKRVGMVQLGGAPAWSMVHVYDCTAIVLGISHIGYPNPYESMENQWKTNGKPMENQWKTNGKPMENQCTCIHLDRLKAGDPGRAKNPRPNQGNILETDGESSHENLCSNKESPPYKTNIGSIGSHFKIQIPNKNNCG